MEDRDRSAANGPGAAVNAGLAFGQHGEQSVQEWAKERCGAVLEALEAKDEAGARKVGEAARAELEGALRADPLHLGWRKVDEAGRALDPDGSMGPILEGLAGAVDEAGVREVLDPYTRRFPPSYSPGECHDLPKERGHIGQPGRGGYVVPYGEVCVLTGAGGAGKTTLALQWALAKALGTANGIEEGDGWHGSGGVTIHPGRTLFATYEDPPNIFGRKVSNALNLPSLKGLARAGGFDAVDGALHVQEMTLLPIFGVPEGAHRSTRPQRLEAWNALWHRVRQVKADLLVIDPVSSAYVADQNASEGVRLFVDSLRVQARREGVTVLLLAHNTKAAQQDNRQDTAGRIAGSAVWEQGTRGCWELRVPSRWGKARGKPHEEPEGARAYRRRHRVLTCFKANRGPRYTRVLELQTHPVEPADGKPFRVLKGFEDTGKAEDQWKRNAEALTWDGGADVDEDRAGDSDAYPF